MVDITLWYTNDPPSFDTQSPAQIGSWWEGGRSKKNDNDQHEVDVVAVYYDSLKVLIAEVKRDKRNFKRQPFEEKVELLRNKYFSNYEIETRCFSLSDM